MDVLTKESKLKSHDAAQDINWKDYRDHLATADKSGRRLWLYPRKPAGRHYRWRTWMTWVDQ